MNLTAVLLIQRKEETKMQINVALEKNSDEQAEIIRKKWYKTTTAQQTRDAFIFKIGRAHV